MGVIVMVCSYIWEIKDLSQDYRMKIFAFAVCAAVEGE